MSACSIFIASSASSVCPLVTRSPTRTDTLTMRPGMGERSAPSDTAAVPENWPLLGSTEAPRLAAMEQYVLPVDHGNRRRGTAKTRLSTPLCSPTVTATLS
jgi:hypothetical protein